MAQAILITKRDFDAKLSSLNGKVTQNKTKYLLVKKELNQLKTFDLSYFIGKSQFEDGDTQNYLIFQSVCKYFKVIADTEYISSWKSKGLLKVLKVLSHLLRLIIVLLQIELL